MVARRIPNLRSQLLGQLLRQRREAARVRLVDAGEAIQRDQSSMSRMESGHQIVRVPDLLHLLRMYEVTDDAVIDGMTKLSKEVFRRAWWDDYADILSNWFADFPWLEERSRAIRSYDALLPCGLLQTRDFAAAMIREVGPDDPKWTDRAIEFRMARQRILDQDNSPKLSVVLDEGVLQRLRGGDEIMRAQLTHLAESSERPNVEIRVLPVATGIHAGLSGGFQVFDMPDLLSDIAWSDTLGGAIYVESDNVPGYRRTYDDLYRRAESPEQSRKLIRNAAMDAR